MIRPPPRSTLFPPPTPSRSHIHASEARRDDREHGRLHVLPPCPGEELVADRVHLGQLTERAVARSEEHTSELQSQSNLVCRLLLEKKKQTTANMAAASKLTS